jgi:predicted O-methyltransferase YrrM
VYSAFQLALKFSRYYVTAANGKGHGIHSPFVFEFIDRVLNDTADYTAYANIEAIRQQLLQNNTEIAIEDMGAGSAVIGSKQRKVKAIAASSLKPKKYAQLLFRMVQYYKPAIILELGTSLGVTTAYLASANRAASVVTGEGSTAIANRATQNFQSLGLTNIHQVLGNFDQTLGEILHTHPSFDFIFIDGNHRKAPTLRYFEQLLPHTHASTLFVFDDIHWSEEMEAAWAQIKAHPMVTVSIDLFFIGIIGINPTIKVKQDFSIRF